MLDAPVVAAADTEPSGPNSAAPIGMPPSASPARASSSAISNICSGVGMIQRYMDLEAAFPGAARPPASSPTTSPATPPGSTRTPPRGCARRTSRSSTRCRSGSTRREALAARRLPGDGHRRQGRHDRARDQRGQPAGRARHVLQAADAHRARARLPVALPARAARRGEIGIFNRSHYEEVLVVRVHPEYLGGTGGRRVGGGAHLEGALDDINAWERHLHASGTRS